MEVWSLGGEDSLEEGMGTQSSILAWEIPWTEEPGELQSIGLQRIRYDWSDLTHTHLCRWCFLIGFIILSIGETILKAGTFYFMEIGLIL